MVRPNLLLIVVPVLILSVIGCAPATETPALAATVFIPETGGTEIIAATMTPVTAATMGTGAAPVPPAMTAFPATTATLANDTDTIIMVSPEGEFAPLITDERGRSLYAYLNDTPNSNESSCVDDCAVEWPPLFVTGIPAAGPGVDARLISTVTRDDGSIQAVYNGWPLYYYNMDTLPGTTNGQGFNGVWFLVSPDGEPIQK